MERTKKPLFFSAEQKGILERVRNYISEEMAANDPAHDTAHVERVVKLTHDICSFYPEANSYYALLLALLHDMQDDKLQSNKGSDTLKETLISLGLTEEDMAFVMEGIPYISYRKYPKLEPDVALEIRIVQDADRIDAMGAIGIARTFAFGGAKGRPLEESIRHFDEKLLHLYDLLGTEVGKELALPRFTFLKEFYNRFQEENISYVDHVEFF